MNERHVITVSCGDRPGLVAAVASWLAGVHGMDWTLTPFGKRKNVTYALPDRVLLGGARAVAFQS